MIYEDNRLTVTLTRQPDRYFIADKSYEEIQNADLACGFAIDGDAKLKIRFKDGVFQGHGLMPDENGRELLYVATFRFLGDKWLMSTETIKRIDVADN